MRKFNLFCSAAAIFIFCFSGLAQEKNIQKIELPKWYLEQKLDQTVINLTATMTAGIAFAKSLGKSPEDFGKFLGNSFSPGWEGMKGKGIAPLFKWMYINLQADKSFKLEIISETEKSVQARRTRFDEATLKEFSHLGVTVEEYDRFWGKLWEEIANYLGLEYTQKVEGNWIIMKINTK